MKIEMEALNIASKYSENIIKSIRENLEKKLNTDLVSVVTVGSFARREASEQSDLDFFVIYSGDKDFAEKQYSIIRDIIEESGVKMPSATGAFAELEDKSAMLKNIGGEKDKNDKLTRRMLLLLECEYLYNQKLYVNLLDEIIEIIEIYVKDGIKDHQMCRFLLNDLIRYYRTICVDFEFKTSEVGKSWGDRNIKLMFSRKLIYFSGLLAVAETVQQTCKLKREILKYNFMQTPLDRIKSICGVKANRVLNDYNSFIKDMSDEDVRTLLNSTNDDRKAHSDDFRDFKNRGHHFSWEISKLLSMTYDPSHPIHHAIKF